MMKSEMSFKVVSTRVFYLDFIRAISILLIIIFHFNVHALQLKVSDSAVFWIKSGFDHICLGVLGISLFIILSGASLMLSTKNKFDLKTFARKRFLSIYPLFWATYAAASLTLLLFQRGLPSTPYPWTFFLTIIGFDGFLLYAIPNYYLLGEWFLGFIIIMYILFPLLRYLFLRNALFTVLLSFLITLSVAEFYHPGMEIFRFPLFRLTEFVLGMSFIYFYSPSRGRLNLFLIAAAGLLFYFSIALNIPAPFNVAMQGISAFTCLAFVGGPFGNSLPGRFVSFLSRYSFGAFLVHHVFFLQILPFFQSRHLSVFNSYLLFFLLLLFIYGMSFLLTNATAFGLRKISATSKCA
jgi:peptidoglycan/LPS O-acetylase OafA/YrhL